MEEILENDIEYKFPRTKLDNYWLLEYRYFRYTVNWNSAVFIKIIFNYKKTYNHINLKTGKITGISFY